MLTTEIGRSITGRYMIPVCEKCERRLYYKAFPPKSRATRMVLTGLLIALALGYVVTLAVMLWNSAEFVAYIGATVVFVVLAFFPYVFLVDKPADPAEVPERVRHLIEAIAWSRVKLQLADEHRARKGEGDLQSWHSDGTQMGRL